MAKNLTIGNLLINGQSLATTPFSLLPGDLIDISWIVSNTGDESMFGGIGGIINQDTVYLSDDEAWDANDVVIGSYNNTTNLDAFTGLYNSKQRISILAGTLGYNYPLTKYLIVKTNSNGLLNERDFTDNIAIMPITVSTNGLAPVPSVGYNQNSADQVSLQVPASRLIGSTPAPDLEITATAPTTAVVGEKIIVNWTVQNTGDLNASKGTSFGWFDSVYLSSDTTLDSADVYIGGDYRTQDLAVNSSYQVNSSQVFIPNGIPSSASNPISILGNQYLIFKTNDQVRQEVGANPPLELGEINFNNNIYTVPIAITAPDLTVTKVTTPISAPVGSTVQVNWTVKNNSLYTATGYWSDYVYLSSDQILDASDSLLYVYSAASTVSNIPVRPLIGGNEYTVAKDITFNTGVVGQQYLIFATDATNVNYRQGAQFESDETNNLFVSPITITASDLKPNNVVSAITTIDFGNPFDVTWSATNIGVEATSGTWGDRIYLSRDNVLSNDDLILSTINRTGILSTGQSYNVTASVKAELPTPLPIDTNGFVSEAEPNSTLASALNLQQNFVKAASNIYSAKVKGTYTDSSDVDYYRFFAAPGDIININIATGAYPRLELYDRNQKSLEFNYGNTRLTYTLPPTAYAGDYYIRTDGFVGAGSYEIKVDVQTDNPFIPSLNQAGNYEGNYYLIVKNDVNNSLVESNETNNVAVSGQSLYLGSPSIFPDLTISGDIFSPDVVVGTTIPVNWVTSNISTTNPAQSGWFDYVYLSDDGQLDNGDILLKSKERANSEAALNAGSFYTVTNEKITLPTGVFGEKNLIFVADSSNNRQETNENNNTNVVKIKIADLTVSNITAPTTSLPGKSVELAWTVTNRSSFSTNANWINNVYLSYDDRIGDDIFIGKFDFVGGVAAGESIERRQSVTIPDSIGNYRFVVKTSDSSQSPQDTTSNASIDDQVIDIRSVDLVVDSISAPSTGISGRKVEIAWTITNRSTFAADGTWREIVYLSSDDRVGNDIYLGEFSFTGEILGGQSVERRQEVVLPGYSVGQYRFVVEHKESPERFYGNSSAIDDQLIQIQQPSQPNLIVANVTAPASVFSGQSTIVSWQVTNSGIASTSSPSWLDTIWLSQDGIIDNNLDFLLATVANPAYLLPGSGYANSSSVLIPRDIGNSASQDWRILVKTDSNNSVREGDNENDNVLSSVPFIISPTPPPDLQVANVVVSPSNPFSGQQVGVSWTVVNRGASRTSPNESQWIDELLIAKNPDGSGEAYSLGLFSHAGSLSASDPTSENDQYTSTQLVTLPIGKWNEYFFVVKTDVENKVYEKAFEDNNIGFLDANIQDTINTPSTIQLTPPPDLTVESVNTSVVDIAAGKALDVTYKVINSGLTEVPQSTSKWKDKFFLSPTVIFNPNTAKLIAEKEHNNNGRVLAAGDSYIGNANLIIPEELTAGSYYLIVFSDFDNDIFEQDDVDAFNGGVTVALSNWSVYTQPINVVSTPPDFIVQNISVIGDLNAGKTGKFTWTVLNQGTGDSIATSWYDQLILSKNDILGDSDDIGLADFQISGAALPSGGVYTRTKDITLPFTLNGSYSLFAVTDRVVDSNQKVIDALSNRVYEATRDDNNTSVAYPIVINRLTPDLLPQSVSANIANAVAGDNVLFSWTVKNIGVGITNVDQWYDRVYLSRDSVFDIGDIQLGQVRRNGSLAAGNSYNGTASFTIPEGIQGEYNIFLQTDAESDRVLEISETNNTINSSGKITVTINPVPDLIVSNVNADASGISSQSIAVGWTVVNNNPTSAVGGWNDSVYLSRDIILDTNDVFLGTVFHANALPGNSSYTESTRFDVPRGLSGSYYVIASADSNKKINERDKEQNNSNSTVSPIQIFLPAPADLTPIASSISFANSGVSGESLSVSYQVKNQGVDTAIGRWTDTLYLSKDDVWDLNDAVFGSFEHIGNVAPNSTYDGLITAEIPGVNPGNYRVIVKSDVRDGVPDINVFNDNVASTSSISVDFDTLTVGSSVSSNLAQSQSVYYKFQGVSGQAIRLYLDSADDSGANGLYVRYGELPTRGQFDRAGNNPFDADQDVIVPIDQTGTYYVMAYGNSVTGVPSFNLSATEVPFSITNVATKTLGNIGKASIKVEGALFEEGTTFQLIDITGKVIDQDNDRFQNSTTDLVTFNLAGKNTGLYDLQATKINGEKTLLKGAITVEEGIGASLNSTIEGPKAVRIATKTPIFVNYGNSGDTDSSAPLLIVRANDKASVSLDPRFDSQLGTSKFVQIYGAGKDIGLDQLRPQETYSVPVYYASQALPQSEERAGVNVDEYTISSTERISDVDWVMLKTSAKPANINSVDWSNFWQSQQPKIGATWGDYTQLVQKLAVAYNKPNESISDVSQLFDRWFADKNAISFQLYPKSVLSGQITDDKGQPIKEVGVILRKIAVDGSVTTLNDELGVEGGQILTDENGKFYIPGVDIGNYRIELADDYTFAPISSLNIFDANYGSEVTKASFKDITVIADQKVTDQKWVAYSNVTPFAQKRTDVKVVVDGQGVNHIFWRESSELWTASFTNNQWSTAKNIGSIDGSYDVQSYKNSVSGSPELLVTWDSGSGNNSEIYYSVSKIANNVYQWSKPISLTTDNIADTNPTISFSDTGNPLIVYQKFDSNSDNDPKHLYYSNPNIDYGGLQWSSLSTNPANVTRVDSFAYKKTLSTYSPKGILGKLFSKATFKTAWEGSLKQTEECDYAKYSLILSGGGEGEFTGPKGVSKGKIAVSGQISPLQLNYVKQSGGYKFESLKVSTAFRASYEHEVTLGTDIFVSLFKRLYGFFGQNAPEWLTQSTDKAGFTLGWEVGGAYKLSVTDSGSNLKRQDVGSGTGNLVFKAKTPELLGAGVEFKLSGGGNFNVQIYPELDGSITARIAPEVKVKFPFRGVTREFVYKRTYEWVFNCKNGEISSISYLGVDPGQTQLTDQSFDIIEVQPFSPTAVSYGLNSVISDISKTTGSDLPATIIQGAGGKSLISWVNKDSLLDDSILFSTFDGTNWSQPIAVFNGGGAISESSMVLDSNNHSVVVWSMSDPNYTYSGPEINKLDLMLSAAYDLSSSADIYYSVLGDDNKWSIAKPIVNLAGGDSNVSVGKTANGNNIITWLNRPDSSGETVLKSSIWDGQKWNTPVSVTSGNLSKPSISILGEKSTIFWSQQIGTGTDEAIFYSSFDDLVGAWSTPVIFEPATLNTNQPQNLLDGSVAGLADSLLDLVKGYVGSPPEDCEDDGDDYDPDTQAPVDPNDIIGPQGYGLERWVNAVDPLEYTIRFENVATANAPAKLVTVTQQLDTDLDWRSFRLDSFSWGDIAIAVPKNSAFFSKRIDVRDQYGVYVDVSASIDIRTGIAKWELRAIDPNTGDIPIDPSKGFLPPNDPNQKGIGEGAVAYRINAKPGITTGSMIDAQASIIFDNNEPIETPKIFNTIDKDLPISNVTVLQPQSNDPNFQLSWTGSDDANGSGIAGYAVYISVNNSDYQILDTVTETTLNFEGAVGDSYSFYVLAIDNTGNIQDETTSTPTSISIGGPGILHFTNTEYSVNESGAAIAAITIQRTNGSIGLVGATVTLDDGTAKGGIQPFFNGIDYDNKPITVSFADGETSKVITLPINNDILIEGNETVGLTLTNPTGGVSFGNQSTAQLTIIDNNILLEFNRTNFQVKEDGTAVNTIQVLRSGRTDMAVGVTLALTGITATSGLDFSGDPIQVNFALGETAKVVTVPIINDTLNEGDETVGLKLLNPSNGAAIGSKNEAVMSIIDDETNLKFNISATSNIDPQALAGFTTAANNWAKTLNNKAEINVSVAFQDLGSGVLGQTVSEYVNYSYADVYAALVRKRLSSDDFQAISNLQIGSDFDLLINRTANSPNGSGSLVPYLDNNANANNTTIRLNRSNAKALGLVAADASSTDTTLIFNSNNSIKWDFNPADGIATGDFDFIGTVTHELGHSLGFESGVDVLDSNKPASEKDYTFVSALDLFRFSANSFAQGKGIIDFTASDTDKYFSINGGETKIASFATGVNFGDGKQPQHWKDGLSLGLLDPSITTGERLQISNLDKRALDVIGWDLKNENTAPTKVTIVNGISTLAESLDPTSQLKIAEISIADDGLGLNNISLSGADANVFEVIGNELYLKFGTNLNYEAKSSYTLTIAVDDPTVGDTPDALTDFTLNITDVNEAPTAVTLANTFASLTENTSTANRLKIADINVADDAIGTNNLSLIGADANAFEIVDNSLYVKSGTNLNYEVKSNYAVTVAVDDITVGNTPDSITNFTLNITDVNEAPTAVTLANAVNSLAENTGTAARLKVADINVADDALGTNNLSLSGADAKYFEIFNGGLYIKAGTVLDFETKSNYVATVAVDDTTVGTTPDASTTFNLTLTDITEVINGNNASDNITGTIGGDIINGLGGSDTIYGDAGNDSLDGGAGQDGLYGDAGNDTLSGGDGADNLYGGIDDDSLIGGANNDYLGGDAGNDTLAGGDGLDDLYGGEGADRLLGEAGDDYLDAGIGNDYLDAGTGDDELYGGDGNDTVIGSGGYDLLYGQAGDDSLDGGSGDDELYGGDGNDTLNGGTRRDTLKGGVGNDVYFIDNINDLVVEITNGGLDTVNSSVSFSLTNNIENLSLAGISAINGIGNSLDNTITGNSGKNLLQGLGGNDTLNGGDGDDTLEGGAGIDNLFGGAGIDTFVLNKNSADNISDFGVGNDRLQISASDFGGGLRSNVALLSNQLRVGAGQIIAQSSAERFIYNTTNGNLYFDADGNKNGFGAIKIGNLSGTSSLGVGTFSIV
jgi:Ca2+-binding RTX toxin-like protein